MERIGTSPAKPEKETSDVLAEDEVVHVSTGAEELADGLEPPATFAPEVPNWDKDD
jgi:hypothetical protein